MDPDRWSGFSFSSDYTSIDPATARERGKGLAAFTPLRHRIAWQLVAVAAAFDANSDQGRGCSASRAKHRDCRQGFVIELGNQVGFLSSDFFPHLPDLDSLICHVTCRY